MKRMSRLLICSLVAAATCTPLFARGKAESVTKPKLLLGVLIDTSTHQRNVIELERQAANSIAEQFDGVTTESFVFTYSDNVKLLQDWSPIDPGLKEASTQIQLSIEDDKRGRTLLYDALDAGLRKLGVRADVNARVLIIIGEGNDAGSVARYSQLKKLAQSNHVQCFALLLADHNLIGGRVRHFGFDLYDLASATKGAGYDIENSRKRLDKAFKDMLKRIAVAAD